MPAKISVVVTCHNYGRFLRECLESILAQERTPAEIIVIDDASTDDTPEIAAAYPVRYERVAFRDACRSYNHGVAISTGDLVAFADADNFLTPRYIGALAAALEADSALGFAYSDRYAFEEKKGGVLWDMGPRKRTLSRSHPPDPAMLIHENFIDTMAMVRRGAFEAVGGFQSMPAIWDYRLWVAILELGWQAHYVPEPLFYYRLHGENMILRERPQLRGCTLLIRREHFTKPFWKPYTTPELGLDATILPGGAVPGATLCRVCLAPTIRGQAFPRAVTLAITLPPGHTLLDLSCAAPHDRLPQQDDGSTIALILYYPIPDRAAAAVPPVVWLTLAVQETQAESLLGATLSWRDIFEETYRHSVELPLPALPIAPPFRQIIAPGWLQQVDPPFTPGEGVSVWAALPPESPVASLALPTTRADERGQVIVDLRFAPRDYAAVVLQGAVSATQAVLVPAPPDNLPTAPAPRRLRMPAIRSQQAP